MNLYRRTNTPARRRLWAATLFVAVILLADAASHGLVRSMAQSAGGSLSGTAVHAFDAIRQSGVFRTRTSLATENERLKTQVAQYESQILAYKALQEENKQLAEMARIANIGEGVTAPIVSTLRSSPYGTFLIGAGTDDGITIGSLVLTDDGFAIGKVSDASPHTALVSEILGPGKKTDAIIMHSATVFDGTGGGNARTQVPRDVKVSVGDLVTSPSALAHPIGIVGKVESEPADAYSTVYMRLPQNTATLRYVYVLSTSQ